MPLALPLILELEKKGYIIIASVSTPEAVEVLEHKCQGYVRALVLDPNEVNIATCIRFVYRLKSISLQRSFHFSDLLRPAFRVVSLLQLQETPLPHLPLTHTSTP